jgi:uncharacterized protein HemX
MKKLAVTLIALVISAGLSVALAAQTPSTSNTKTPVIRKRQQRQQQRVRQGVRSGELTRKETQQIRGQQQEIRQDKQEAKSDGVVTKQERAAIHREQNQASRNIYRKKHNRRDRN